MRTDCTGYEFALTQIKRQTFSNLFLGEKFYVVELKL